ncbi:small ribosomal subunit protein mS26 [Trichomonascus vanleenenianus]|uniref:mitochondrial 37S ribosomal protein mS26 PET123 n=1 Tax=Trichomonascus vanleenenianus TaxID=2268995 RepID=UPI003ECBA3D6
MVKRTARFGFKSGVLPRKRDILPPRKTFWEKQAEEKIKVGFSDPEMVPKGVPAKPVVKQEKSAAERIAYSAKEPVRARKENTELQRWKNMTSDIRRAYFKDSLLAEDRMNEKTIARRERQFREAREARLKIDNQEESEATRLTLPTIETFINGSFVRQRTAEEKEQLRLKREANRKLHSVRQQEAQAAALLELYQHAGDFVINEEGLDRAINNAFNPGENRQRAADIVSFSSQIEEKEKERMAALTQALFGITSNRMPGLPAVEEALSGEKQKRLDSQNQS